ncbi:FtsH protease activity modulator HflK [Paracoccus aminophilus]|uniref:Protein HflK n=1 Tax=Paracoccus aminophilus JCM 7686 TaxID=1367847 RepID=S5XYI0_PARAH|nr:FtsH protease activity modulator HflK [Paracoccus aminophilus]AGT08490.1 membrane protease subunit HflK [Paracoccus aminophilus JCM 7686]
MAAQGPWGGGGDNGKGGDKKPPQSGPQRPWGEAGGNDDRNRQQPPGGPRRGEQIPEIEELVRKGQDRLRVLMGGRGGSGGPGGGGPRGQGPRFSLGRGTWAIIGIGAVAVWAFSSFYQVTTGEQSVELLFGKPVSIGTEGLNFAPWPAVRAEVVNVTGERVTEIGTGKAGPLDSGLMLTRDQNIVDMEYQVVWNVSDPEKFLFNLADPRDTIRAVAESAMRDIVARSELAPILNRDRGAIASDLTMQIQQTLDAYDAGIHVLRVNLDRADPPSEVIDSFREVQAAQQERDRLEKEADAYANRVLASARGESAAMIERAEAYRAEAVNSAQGEAARFNSVYDEYVKAPEVTRRRMYIETMEKVLGGASKIILDGKASESGVVPYLPLDQLRKLPVPGSDQAGGTN